MRYPSFLKKGGTIGLIAPSFGVSSYPYEEKYENAVKKFRNLGYNIVECDSVRNLSKLRSNTPAIRAAEFMQMYTDYRIDFIVSVGGGEIMMEMLPYIDFELLRQSKPKFFMGFSDNTNLTFTLNTLTDTASIYALNFPTFGMASWDPSIQETYDIITGKRLTQQSYPMYVKEDVSKLPGNALAGFSLTEYTSVESLDNSDGYMRGRLVGGCLDVLGVLCGTTYGNVNNFVERYRDDGIIWYLEACELNCASIYRTLWQLKNAGWFKYARGFIFGRAADGQPVMDFDMKDALSILEDLNAPVIYDADFGHIPPSWTIISGAKCVIHKKGHTASIEYILD